MNLTPKQVIKSAIGRVSPQALSLIQASRMRLGFRRQFGMRQCYSKDRIFGSGCEPSVLSGPFEGMKYFNETVWGPIEPKWIGCYEEELHGVIEKVIRAEYEAVIDVGSAEGYYAVGLAWRCPHARVFSYDTDIWSRLQQRRLARLNNVVNLKVGTVCGWNNFDCLRTSRTFVLCDIEGAEYDLLDPDAAPSLKHCDMLVEVHPHGKLSGRQVCDALTERFAGTHNITEIGVNTSRGDDIHSLLGGRLSAREIATYVDENRDPKQVWLWLETFATSNRHS